MTEIEVTDDFSLELIANSGQCFRWTKEAPDTYRIIHLSHLLLIHSLGEGRFSLSCSEQEFREIWHSYFDFGTDYLAIRKMISLDTDPFLYHACEYGKGIRILQQDPWETLVSFIISQNKNIPAIRKSIELLCSAAGKSMTDEKGETYHLFPTPQEILALDDAALSACKLGYRCRYVRAAAESVLNERLPLNQLAEESEERVMQALTSVTGVGVKVASCVSLFGLHHLDAFPVDVWIRRILDNEYADGYPREQYFPYNGVYQQYMFYYYRGFHGGE